MAVLNGTKMSIVPRAACPAVARRAKEDLAREITGDCYARSASGPGNAYPQSLPQAG